MTDRLTINLQGNGTVVQRRTILGVARPRHLTAGTQQLVQLLRDGSPSMSGVKAVDAEAASRRLIEELARPENMDGFMVSIGDFSDTARIVTDTTRATAVAGSVPPLSVGGSGTDIAAALTLADRQIRNAGVDAQGARAHLRPVCILFTDGQHNGDEDPEPIAASVRSQADLVCVAFGDDADMGLLQRLATSPQHAYRCRDGADLRAFLAAVGQTLTQTMARRANATVALSQLQP